MLEADSAADLDDLTALTPSSDVADLDGPGGGWVVHATDPNGYQVEVVAGRGWVGRLPTRAAPDSQRRRRLTTAGALPTESGLSHIKRDWATARMVDYR